MKLINMPEIGQMHESEPDRELVAAMILNAFNSARLYHALKGLPEPEEGKLLEEIIEAWKYVGRVLGDQTKQE